jgi:multidrug efflux system membrane fusion protein
VLRRLEARRPKIGLLRRHWLVAAVVVAALGYWGWRTLEPGRTSAQDRGEAAHARQAEQPAPVHVAIVEKTDFPVFLNGLGTVQAANTVTVRSRVDGQIEKVAFEEGQMVKDGDLLVQIDPAPFQAALDQAIARLAQDEANLNNAKRDLQRTSTLAKQGDATQQLLDQQTANVAQLNAQVQADNAAIESAKVQLGYTTIKSPVTGRAGFRLVDAGNIVHASDQSGILTITQLQPVAVVFTAPEQQLPNINDAVNEGPLKVTAFSSDGRKPLGQGTLTLVDNQVDTASGTIRLKANFDNADHALWPGLSVSTRLLVTIIKDVVVVPDSAVQRGPKGLFAYVVGSDNKAEMRDLKVARIADGHALVEQGLAPGARIITSGQYRVRPGRLVEILNDLDQPVSVKPTGGIDQP